MCSSRSRVLGLSATRVHFARLCKLYSCVCGESSKHKKPRPEKAPRLRVLARSLQRDAVVTDASHLLLHRGFNASWRLATAQSGDPLTY